MKDNFKQIKKSMSENASYHEIEKEWKEFYVEEAPMGELLVKNSLFEMNGSEDSIFVHITPSLQKVITSKQLLPSGGGLGACIYVIPLRKDGSLHNLGEFILNFELPSFLKAQGKKKKLDLIAIKVDHSVFKSAHAIKEINYIEWGKKYLNAYKGLSNKKDLIKDLDLKKQLKQLNEFVILSAKENVLNISYEKYLNTLIHLLDNTHVLKSIYFESILEYCYLFQNDSVAYEYKKKGEMHANHTKLMIFDLCPDMKKRFSLKTFNVKPNQIASYLKIKSRQHEFIIDFDESHFYEFLKLRLAQQLRLGILGGEDKITLPYDIHSLIKEVPQLAGHILFRTLKGSYEYEFELAKILWKEWDKAKNYILLYKNLPKGEMGINPNIPKNAYEIYSARMDSHKVILDKRLDVEMLPRLIDTKSTVMRNPYTKN